MPSPDPGDSAGDPLGDDLTEIDGIGAKTAGRLRAAGIDSFAGLAEADPGELAHLANVSRGYVEQRDWTGQAAALARATIELLGPPHDQQPRRLDDLDVQLTISPP